MLEITAKQIGELSDTDLRILITRLSEKQIRAAQLPVSSVTAGGDQRAKDGGLDVRVDLPSASPSLDFIPRRLTGFQVKQEKSAFARKKILGEMRPKGIVRPVLKELAGADGAYIIVSGRESPSDSGLLNRRAAMREAVDDIPGSSALVLDFYGGDRVAQWTNQYPGLVAWVLDRLGRPSRGWRPFGNWASANEPVDAEYLLDQTARLYEGSHRGESGLAIEAGLNRIRAIAAQLGKVIRLVGLSGTGKTRFVQALFDTRIGKDALDQDDVIYADIADEPEPTAGEMIDHLANDGHRAILVVDNCPPSTHRALSEAMARHKAGISLITVEFDVGEDEPESTDIFRLEPASSKVIVDLVKRRIPEIAQLDRQRIANLSGGNARLALALARAVRNGEDTSKLTDAELFERLFYQRQHKETALLVAAEAAALVYSFDGLTLEGEGSELLVLAGLARQDVGEFYHHTAQLIDRDLVQRRSKWRAVLPHALAIYLAHRALSHIPVDTVCLAMESRAPARLLQSFTRRLGYLHDNQYAQTIVGRWLSDGGILSDVSRLAPQGKRMLQNIAPIDPSAVLTAIERATERDRAIFEVQQTNRNTLLSILRSIAYDPRLFSRSANLLARFLASEPGDNRHNSAASDFKELFHITLSGTHASIEQRIELVNSLLESPDNRIYQCGLIALDELLEASRFGSSHDFHFGGRVRDFGWRPAKPFDVRRWYRLVLSFATKLIATSDRYRAQIKSILASNFRALWTVKSIRGSLIAQFRVAAGNDFWSEGWIAVQTTISFDSKTMRPFALKRLRRLSHQLRPNNLLETAKTYVLAKAWGALDVAEVEEDRTGEPPSAKYARVEETIRGLGQEVAMNEGVLQALLPDVVSTSVGRARSFGMGLAEGSPNLDVLVRQIVGALAATKETERDVGLLQGVLSVATEKDPISANVFLNDAVKHPILGVHFVLLQAALPIAAEGVRRLREALEFGSAPLWTFHNLVMGRSCDQIPPAEFVEMILRIAERSDGYPVAASILSMYMYSASDQGAKALDPAVVRGARAFLQKFGAEVPDRPDAMLDHYLGEIAKIALADDGAYSEACSICRKISESENTWGVFHEYEYFIASIFQTQPLAALDELVGDDKDAETIDLLADSLSPRNYLWKVVPIDTLLSWANVSPQCRFPVLAAIIGLFPREGDEDVLIPAALELIRQAPDKNAVLSQFESSLEPDSWVGSRATSLENRRALLQKLVTTLDQVVAGWVRRMDERLVHSIASERANEKRRDETFE